MVQINLFAGHEYRCRHREWMWTGSGGCDELGEIGIEIYKLTMCEMDS